MLPHCVTNQRKSRMVVSMRACLRVCGKRRCQDNQRPLFVCVRVCGCNVSDSPCHESVGRGLGRSASYYSESAFISPSPPPLHSTSSSFISAIVPHSVFYPFTFPFLAPLLLPFSLFLSLFHPSIVPQGPKEVLEMWKRVCVCVCFASVLKQYPLSLFCVFSHLLSISSSLFQVSLSVIFNVKLIYLPISPLILSRFVPW